MTQITSHSSKDIASVGVVTQKRLFLKSYYFSNTGSFIKRVLSLHPPQIKLQSVVERRLNKLAFAIDNTIDNVVISRLY